MCPRIYFPTWKIKDRNDTCGWNAKMRQLQSTLINNLMYNYVNDELANTHLRTTNIYTNLLDRNTTQTKLLEHNNTKHFQNNGLHWWECDELTSVHWCCAKQPLRQDKQQHEKRSTSEKSKHKFEEIVYYKTESHYTQKHILES